MHRKKIFIAVIIIVILVSGYLLKDYFANLKELPNQKPPVVSANYVRVSEVQYENIETEIVAFGRVTSSHSLNIIAEVGGRLLPGQVAFKPGENFRKGQVLFRIYDAEARLTLQSRKSEFLNQIVSILPDMKIDFNDNYEAWQQYFDQIEIDKPLQEFPEPKSTKEKTFLATRNILRDFYSIRSSEENLRKYTIYAPYDGSITAVNLEVGTIVNPGSNIASIIRTDELELEVPVEVKNIKWIVEGVPVMVMSEDEGRSWQGIIERIGDYVDPTSQSINVYISLDASQNPGLYDGLYLKAIIEGSTLENALEVPRRTLMNDNQVFVVENGTLKAKKVNIQKINRDNVLINGLTIGDSLVLEAPVNAFENMKVSVFKGEKKQQKPDSTDTIMGERN